MRLRKPASLKLQDAAQPVAAAAAAAWCLLLPPPHCTNQPSLCPAQTQVAAIGSAMVKSGLLPHGRVGVYGANSPEWMMAMQVRLRARLGSEQAALLHATARADAGGWWRPAWARMLAAGRPPPAVQEAPRHLLPAAPARPRHRHRPATGRTCTACRCTTRWARTRLSTSSRYDVGAGHGCWKRVLVCAVWCGVVRRAGGCLSGGCAERCGWWWWCGRRPSPCCPHPPLLVPPRLIRSTRRPPSSSPPPPSLVCWPRAWRTCV